jgi:predicted glycoside hydrolase/deacetylase ChbG (UPF0249 family)
MTDASRGLAMSHDANPLLRRLGFGPRDRVVILQADDIGMCEATIAALPALADSGLMTSTSVMVPCPWFSAAAEWLGLHPEVDCGVHITLTSEWEHYRWRPLSTLDPASGLVDDRGFMPRSVEELERRATADAALAEARAQLMRARAFGLRPSHLDAHMLALRQLFPTKYVELALEAKLPVLIEWLDVTRLRGLGANATILDERALPVFDHIAYAPNDGLPEDRVSILKGMFDRLPPGLSCLITHPACDTPELRAIVPKWRYRVADYMALQDAALLAHVRSSGIHLVTYRDLAGPASGSAARSG